MIIQMRRFYDSAPVARMHSHAMTTGEVKRLAVRIAYAYIVADGTPDRCRAKGVTLITLHEFLSCRELAQVTQRYDGEMDLDAIRATWHAMLGAVGLGDLAPDARADVALSVIRPGEIITHRGFTSYIIYLKSVSEWVIVQDFGKSDSVGNESARCTTRSKAIKALVKVWTEELAKRQVEWDKAEAKRRKPTTDSTALGAPGWGAAEGTDIYAIFVPGGRLACLVRAESEAAARQELGEWGARNTYEIRPANHLEVEMLSDLGASGDADFLLANRYTADCLPGN